MIFLTQDHPLAKAELDGLGKNIKQIGNKLYSGTVKQYERLAFTRYVGKEIKKTPFGTIRVFPHDILLQEALDRAGDIKADMKHPNHILDIYPNIMTERLFEVTEDFESRRSHLRPAPSAHSLHPKLARALVNMTGCQKGTILDPFCGSGGFLIEAGLVGLKTKGFDIDAQNVEWAQKNCAHYKIKTTIKKKDALTMPSTSYVVTDLPYGKSSKKSEALTSLYEKFAIILSTKLKKRAVIMSPDFLDFAQYARKQKNLKILACYDLYVHRSLTRKVCVIERT